MDNIIKIIRMDLYSNQDSTIYFLDESQKDIYEEIKQMVLQNEDKYLDVILDSKDFEEVLSALKGTSEKIKKMFMLDYVINKILTNAGFTLEKDESIWPELMVRMLNNMCINKSKVSPRIHFFLDDVNDAILQTKINDLFASRGLTTVGYTTKSLSTYETSKGLILDGTHDYREVHSDKYQDTLNKEYQRKREQFNA